MRLVLDCHDRPPILQNVIVDSMLIFTAKEEVMLRK